MTGGSGFASCPGRMMSPPCVARHSCASVQQRGLPTARHCTSPRARAVQTVTRVSIAKGLGQTRPHCVQGENFLLSVHADELQEPAKLTDSDGEDARRLAATQDIMRAAFWGEWSAGKPVLVRGLHGQMAWTPAVRAVCTCFDKCCMGVGRSFPGRV